MSQYDDGRQVDLSVLDAQQSQLDLTFREIVAAEILHSSINISIALDLVRKALRIVQREVEQNGCQQLGCQQLRYQVPMMSDATLGRPRF